MPTSLNISNLGVYGVVDSIDHILVVVFMRMYEEEGEGEGLDNTADSVMWY